MTCIVAMNAVWGIGCGVAGNSVPTVLFFLVVEPLAGNGHGQHVLDSMHNTQ